MIGSKKINTIAIVAMCAALLGVSVLFVVGNLAKATGSLSSEPEYATKLFGTDIISIEILADSEDWREMLDNALSEEFIMADVIVNGTKFQNVGIRPKGNSSLTQVANSDSDRYSFRLVFDEYIKGQTCFGLESFVVNNMLGDNTYMKEYVSYDLMREIGVDAPYTGFANIQVNNEAWGLYLAVELYNDSYENRVFGDTSGMLYNVKSMDMGGGQNYGAGRGGARPNGTDSTGAPFGDGAGQAPPDFAPSDSQTQNKLTPPSDLLPDTDDESASSTRPMGGQGNAGGGGNSGGSLAYSDDDSSSYSAIFGNTVGKSQESDDQRVIEALKALSEGQDLETYFDVDQILRYLAAHTVSVNLDSYSSSMAQNYYIYERDGQITILPWDYNLAWGGFQSGSASAVINFPIDTPVSGIEMSSRPLLEKLFANEEYLQRYHSYLQELLDSYFADGQFEAKINALDSLISEYVKNDATAFCSYEEYQAGVAVFVTLGNLRAESIQGQLDGTIPSTTAGQSGHPDALIPAGDLKLSALGSMGGGGNRPGGNMENHNQDRQTMEQAMAILRASDEQLTDEQLESLRQLGLTDAQIEEWSARSREGNPAPGGNSGAPGDMSSGDDAGSPDIGAPGDGMEPGGGDMGGGGPGRGMGPGSGGMVGPGGNMDSNDSQNSAAGSTLLITGISSIVLLLSTWGISRLRRNY